MIDLITLNNLINLNLKFNRKYIKLKKSRTNLIYIQNLINLNILKFIKVYDNRFLHLHLNINNNYKSSLKLINLYKPSQKKTVKFKNLKSKNLNKTHLFIISSSNGINLNSSSGLLISSVLI